MKIKDIVLESWGDYALLRKRAAAQKQAGITKSAMSNFKINPQRVATPAPDAQPQAIQPVQPVAPNTAVSKLGPNWIDTTLGISIKPATQTSPTMAFYQKKYYILTNKGQWNKGQWLTANRRPVPDTMAALLNQALEQS